jgi:hypothetical protein
MIMITVTMVNTRATVTDTGGAGAVPWPLRRGNVSTQYTNVATSRPITVWLVRSRMNERITRGDSCELASCKLTIVSEKMTPAVVMVAPAMVVKIQMATSASIAIVSGIGLPAPLAPSTAPAAMAKMIPPMTMTTGSKNKLSRNR